jgi:hypothetical protein
MSILLFLVTFIATLWLQRWLHQRIQGLAFALTGDSGCAVRLLFYLLIPGIALHEASHWVAATVLGVRTGKMRIGLGRAKGNQLSLGSIVVEKTDVFRESLIGLAPFIVGLGAILLIAYWGFGLSYDAGLSFQQMLDRVLAYSNDWTTWLDLYLIFAVSTAMIPSDSDREAWRPLLLTFGLIALVAILLGWTPRIPAEVITPARQVLDALTFAFGISLAINGTVALGLWILEWVVKSVKRK